MTDAEILAVVSPTGAKLPAPAWTPGPELSDLTGKTICEVWDYIYRGDVMFEVIRRELRARYEGLRFVHWSEFGNIHGATEAEVIAALPDRLREHGADLALVGVGN